MATGAVLCFWLAAAFVSVGVSLPDDDLLEENASMKQGVSFTRSSLGRDQTYSDKPTYR